jgi:hypothetical protein
MFLPDFVKKEFRTRSCRRCKRRIKLTQDHVLGCGLSVTTGVEITFDLKVRCPACMGEFLLTSRQPAIEWAELFEWMQHLYGQTTPPQLTQATHTPWDEHPFQTRPVTLLSATPGRSDCAISGEQVAIISFEYDGEVDLPLILPKRDAQKLMVSLLAILAHHGDEKAQFIVENHYMG